LPEGAIVIRGGMLASARDLAGDAQDCFDWLERRGEAGVYGISVGSLPDGTADQIARALGTDRLPHPRMRISTVAALRGCGCEVVPSGRRGHATLIFGDAPTDEDWKNLQAAFSEEADNPVARKPRSGR